MEVMGGVDWRAGMVCSGGDGIFPSGRIVLFIVHEVGQTSSSTRWEIAPLSSGSAPVSG